MRDTTKDQISTIMLFHGTETQRIEALEYFGLIRKEKQMEEDDLTYIMNRAELFARWVLEGRNPWQFLHTKT